jgi:hypothetical protein
MTKSLEQIQQENRKFILEAIGEYSDEFYSKPLTLSRVLLALKSKEDLSNPKKYELYLGITKLFYYNYAKNIELVLDLKKETLEEQSEETQRAINELFNN